MKLFRKGKLIRVIRWGFGSVVLLIIAGSIIQGTYLKGNLAQIEPYGQLVDVMDGQMHIFPMGRGEKTIVLLPGMGIGLPSADFSPLMRELSKNYSVVAVEYFGVGFSSTTARSRTADNYIEEVRAALNLGGYTPPYILMPHSISGVYSEYYASKYPEEIEAIISLDGTSTAYCEDMPSFVEYVLPIAKFMQNTGALSLLAKLTANKEKLVTWGYSEKEIHDMIAFSGFALNDNVLHQIANTSQFVKDAIEHPYPESVPYFKVISRQTYETPNRQLKITPQEYQKKHLERIGANVSYEILEGSHFIYANNEQRIGKITDELIFSSRQLQ